MSRLVDKIALVTGAGTGIGQSTAVQLANEGEKVVITGRNELTLRDTAELHPNSSDESSFITGAEIAVDGGFSI